MFVQWVSLLATNGHDFFGLTLFFVVPRQFATYVSLVFVNGISEMRTFLDFFVLYTVQVKIDHIFC